MLRKKSWTRCEQTTNISKYVQKAMINGCKDRRERKRNVAILKLKTNEDESDNREEWPDFRIETTKWKTQPK